MKNDALWLPCPLFADVRLVRWAPGHLLFGGRVDSAGDGAATAERNLVMRARGGDPESFRILVERHQRAAFVLAARILRSPEDAEDAAQEAFVRAWRALPAFRGDSGFATWLLRIVTRCAFDHLARTRRRKGREMPLDEKMEEAIPDSGAVVPPGRAELRLLRLVDTLPDMQRAVVALYYLQEHSVEEVARTLEIPVGTVKTHLHRARAALRGAWMREAAVEERDGLRGI